jgi:hypothetical protein
MKHITKFDKFISEEISGTELVGPMGPGYGETRLQNKTINNSDTNLIYSELDNRIYTEDEYIQLYGEYLKLGGGPLPEGFNKENIEEVLFFLQKD